MHLSRLVNRSVTLPGRPHTTIAPWHSVVLYQYIVRNDPRRGQHRRQLLPGGKHVHYLLLWQAALAAARTHLQTLQHHWHFQSLVLHAAALVQTHCTPHGVAAVLAANPSRYSLLPVGAYEFRVIEHL